MISIFTLLISLQSHAVFLGGCPDPKFTQPQYVHLTGDKMVLVTHASTVWDGRFAAKAGVNQTVEFGKKHNIPVVYLQDPDQLSIETSKSYYYSDCEPTYTVESLAGEFDFNVSAKHVYTVGGHWDACEMKSIESLIRKWKQSQPTENLTITYVMDGLYLYGSGVTSDDSYYKNWNIFLDTLSKRNPRAQWETRKVNLLEAWNIISSTDKEEKLMTEFLKEQLPRNIDSFPAHYQIELWLDGNRLEIIRNAAPSDENVLPPVLKLEYIRSVYTSADLLIDG